MRKNGGTLRGAPCRDCGEQFLNGEGHWLCLSCAETAWELLTVYNIDTIGGRL